MVFPDDLNTTRAGSRVSKNTFTLASLLVWSLDLIYRTAVCGEEPSIWSRC